MNLKNVKKHLRVYKIFFVAFLKSRLIYKTDFVLGVLSQTIHLVFSLAFLTLIFTQVESIQGWGFNEILLLVGFGGLILNLHHIFLFALYTFGEDKIVTGRFDRFLVRPLNPLFQVYASYVSDNNISKLLVNIALIVYAGQRVDATIFTFENLLYGSLATVSGVLVLAGIFLGFATTAFWTGRSKAVFWLFFNVSDFRKYPFGIYALPIQLMLVTVIPIAFASFFPVTFFLEREQWRIWQYLSLVAGPIFFLVSYKFWSHGVSNYSSTGS